MDQSKKISEVYSFDEKALAKLAMQEVWWRDALAWYQQVKNESFSQLTMNQKGWLEQMKAKLAAM